MENKYLVVECSALPTVFSKVVLAKKLLKTGKAASVSDAVLEAGISRSAYYKYKDVVFPFVSSSNTVTVTFDLEDKAGMLSKILLLFADAGANIRIINQSVPVNGIANVTVTFETRTPEHELEDAFSSVFGHEGVKNFKIIAIG